MELRNDRTYYRPGGKYIWRNRQRTIKLRRIGPDDHSRHVYYAFNLRGGWGIVEPHEIDDLIKLLQKVRQDAEDREI